MTVIWNYVNKKLVRDHAKISCFLIANVMFWGMIGFLLWSVIQLFALKKIDYALCFIGYPAFFIGIVGGTLFLWKKY